MNLSTATSKLSYLISNASWLFILRNFFAGILVPLGFAPFHFPGLSILGISLLFAGIEGQKLKQSIYSGFIFGLGFMGFGVSWIFISIHNYGHLNIPLTALVTLVFVSYLALFYALMTGIFTRLASKTSKLLNCILFSALWCVSEVIRGTFFTGFPWLSLGFGQIDTPLQFLLPIVGVYGISFIACLAATFLTTAVLKKKLKSIWLIAFLALILGPLCLKSIAWSKVSKKPISIGVIQANLSMRDKWDESLFWHILELYQTEILHLIGKKQVIILPESAIPVPANYVHDFLDDMNNQAKAAGSSIILGIPQAYSGNDNDFYNSVTALGLAKGSYFKQHLVPFGEFIPNSFKKIWAKFNLPESNILPFLPQQKLVSVNKHPIACLICYELAFPGLVKNQLPKAEWIVSVTDDGWFGHSLAVYQHLQMARALSIATARYQVVANNNGLSSIITPMGIVSDSLPAFISGTLEGEIFPSTGITPWVKYGDRPIIALSILIILYASLRRIYAFKHPKSRPLH